MMDEKGQGGNMDFLEPSAGGKGSAKEGKGSGKVGGGRAEQNAKEFGFGGKKRDVKKNDKRSTDDISGFRPGQKTRAGGAARGRRGAGLSPPSSRSKSCIIIC